MSSTFDKSKYDLTDRQIVSVIDDLPLWSAPFGLKLLDAIRYKKYLKVLDVGSGLGFPTIEIAARLGETCSVYGIDPWKEANERAEQKASIWNIPNLTIIEGHAENLPFNNNEFDIVTSNNGINNVQNENLVWSEISRVTKSGGQFVFTVNLPDSMIEFYDILIKVLEKNSLFEEIEDVEEHIYHKRKPLDHFFEMIELNGFKLVRITEDVFNFKYTDGTALLNHFFIKLAFRESWLNLLSVEHRESVFIQLEKELNDYSDAHDCIKLTIPFVCIDSQKK